MGGRERGERLSGGGFLHGGADMAGCLGAVLALAFGLLLGGANAGEETMAMRGVARSGRAEVAMPRIAPGADRPSAGTHRNPDIRKSSLIKFA